MLHCSMHIRRSCLHLDAGPNNIWQPRSSIIGRNTEQFYHVQFLCAHLTPRTEVNHFAAALPPHMLPLHHVPHTWMSSCRIERGFSRLKIKSSWSGADTVNILVFKSTWECMSPILGCEWSRIAEPDVSTMANSLSNFNRPVRRSTYWQDCMLRVRSNWSWTSKVVHCFGMKMLQCCSYDLLAIDVLSSQHNFWSEIETPCQF